jgi:hypothetical protein
MLATIPEEAQVPLALGDTGGQCDGRNDFFRECGNFYIEQMAKFEARSLGKRDPRALDIEPASKPHLRQNSSICSSVCPLVSGTRK